MSRLLITLSSGNHLLIWFGWVHERFKKSVLSGLGEFPLFMFPNDVGSYLLHGTYDEG